MVIYGDERYTRDFIYLFDDIQIDTFVDDEKNSFADSWEVLKEMVENVFVIICKYEESNARENLESIGFVRNKDYASATVFFEKLDFPLSDIAQEKRIYVMGAEWEYLKSHTIIHDWLGHGELIALYQKMHFLVIARNVCQRTLANFPSKVPEVMSLGIVPVVSDVVIIQNIT